MSKPHLAAVRAGSISFSGGAPWGALNQQEAQRLARDSSTGDRAIRVWLAALAYSNRIGHAQFSTGGLARVLQDVNLRTGEITAPTASAVSKAVSTAKARGLIHETSNARCLVLSDRLWQKQGKGSAECGVHGILRSAA